MSNETENKKQAAEDVQVEKEFLVKAGKPFLKQKRAFTTNLQFFPCPDDLAKEKAIDRTGREYYRNLIWTYNLGKFDFTALGQADYGLPYGIVSRLIINWIDNEIIYNSNGKKIKDAYGGYKIKWSETITEFCINKLGITKHSKVLKEIQSQFEKIAGMTFKTVITDVDSREERSIPFVVDKKFKWMNDIVVEDDSWIIIHPVYVNYVLKRKFYVAPNIMKLFLRNPEGIDLYKYFKYIKNTQKTATTIKISEIRDKLGFKGKSANLLRKVEIIADRINANDDSIFIDIVKGTNQNIETVIIIN